MSNGKYSASNCYERYDGYITEWGRLSTYELENYYILDK